MKSIIDYINKILSYMVHYKFLVALAGFLLWISFGDTYNLVDRFKNMNKLNILKKEAEFFRQEIDLYQSQYNELFSDKKDIEKFAREQFYMKESDEDVFIIIPEQ